jgi:hypothetical protein
MIDVDKPVLFDCVVDPAENCFPMIPSGRAHNEMILGDAGISVEDAVTGKAKCWCNFLRHARARPAHPSSSKRWIAGLSPAMTS